MTTPMNELIAQNAPEEIALSGFKRGTEIRVMLRTPSLYALLAANTVPNPLLAVVNRLFASGPKAKDVAAPDVETSRAMQVLARETLAEPTMEELEQNGVRLTDRQMLEIALYATRGAEALAAFRGNIGLRAGGDEPNVPDAAEPAAASD